MKNFPLGHLAFAAAFGLAFVPAAPSSAYHWHGHGGAASGLIGGVVGGIIGGAIAGSAAKGSQQQAEPQKERVIVRERVVRQPAQNNYERDQNRNVQNALNYFGFDAGAPDGVLGRRSRSAVSQYQATLNFPVTGHLSEYERSFLLSSHARAQANSVQSAQYAAQYGGQRGILVAYQQAQQAGATMQPVAPVVVAPQPHIVAAPQQPQVVINNAPAPAAAAPAATTQAVAATQPEPEAEEPKFGAMPNFIGGPVEASMASFCNKTSLLTGSKGGLTTVSTLEDPTMAVAEQFCLARTYAIDEGERLTRQVQGVTLAQMQEQCAAFAPTMREYMAAMVAKPPAEATNDLQRFVIGTGVNPAQLAANSKICLSIGYRSDSSDVALASALVLVGLGEAAYGEMLGHHMAQGFGAPTRLDRAAEWYEATAVAFEGGARRVVAPGASDRPELLRATAVMLRGGGAPAAEPAVKTMQLPTFGMPTAPATEVAN